MNVRKQFTISIAVFLVGIILVTTASAMTPPYPSGGSGQSNSGKSTVYTTTLVNSAGKINMYGNSYVGAFQSGSSNSWGQYECNYFTASSSTPITCFTNVKYVGTLHVFARSIWLGSASAYASVYQELKVYDTSNWQIVAQDSRQIYDKTVSASGAAATSENTRRFNGDIVSQSVIFTPTVGHSYVTVVRISCNAQASAFLSTEAAAYYDFWTPDNYLKINEISHT